jgi:fluoride ion exporter CrcB/FEX
MTVVCLVVGGSLSWDTLHFLQVRDVFASAMNIVETALLGLLAVYGGTVLARSVS